MALERMVVTNHERWGNLVKTWATGHNYLEDENEYPIPETVDEFKNQLAKAQVFMTVPERYKQVKFVAQDYDTIPDIAEHLYLSVSTVSNYITAAISKTDAQNRADRAMLAKRR